MRAWSAALGFAALALAAGCASSYEVRVAGQVRQAKAGAGRLDADWPDSDGDGDRARLGFLDRPIAGAHVTVALEFGDSPATLETRKDAGPSGEFELGVAGESDRRLTQVHIRVEAPGYLPVEKTLTPCKICSNGELYLGTRIEAHLEPTQNP
jgi:hypothetical protein